MPHEILELVCNVIPERLVQQTWCRIMGAPWRQVLGRAPPTAQHPIRQRRTSKYIGVSWRQTGKVATCGKWKARFSHNGKEIFIGMFNNEVDAARAFDSAVREVKGAAAQTNFDEHGLRLLPPRKKCRR